MRLNQFLARSTGMSRRRADQEISIGKVLVNGNIASLGTIVEEFDVVEYNGKIIERNTAVITLLLHKPAGYVCSRNGQGSKTIYELLPENFSDLKPVGRLDKDSSGLLLMTNDGNLANRLSHPRYEKIKVYQVQLNKPLSPLHQQMINDFGIQLEDGPSKLILQKLDEAGREFQVHMHEGRNRQIRRTFAALGYTVTKLHRTSYGNYRLGKIKTGKWEIV